jgi:hypothetical protein
MSDEDQLDHPFIRGAKPRQISSMAIHSLLWLVTLALSAELLISATAIARSEHSQLQPDPLFLFNNPSHQWDYELKAHIPHDERIYSLWNRQINFNDQDAIEKLSAELMDLKTQLLEQALDIKGHLFLTEQSAKDSKYYPFEDTKSKLEAELYVSKFERDPTKRERKQISLRQSIGELEAEEKHFSQKLNQLQEVEEDIMATAHEVGKTILAIDYPDLWLSYFENARSVRQMYENEGGVGKDHRYGEANCILAEDFGGPSFEPIGPRLIELGDSVSGDSRESAGTNPRLPKQILDHSASTASKPTRGFPSDPSGSQRTKIPSLALPAPGVEHLPETKKAAFTMGLRKEHAIFAATLAAGLAIGGVITWAWHRLKAKKGGKKSASHRRHQRQWSEFSF